MNQHSNNFDFIRIFAASLVIIGHSFDLLGKTSGGDPLGKCTGLQFGFGFLGVGIFFSISGYLITQSLLRSKTYKSYFIKRSLRIYPALIVDLLIAVFLLGPLVTSLPLGEYFSSSDTFRYLGNISLFSLSLNLPGVFKDSPTWQNVNLSLWTLPYEAFCYMAIVLLHKLKVFEKRHIFALLYLLLFVCYLYCEFVTTSDPIFRLSITPRYLTIYSLYFGAGALLFLFKDKIPLNFWISAALLIAVCLATYCYIGVRVSFIAIPYITIWFVFQQKIRLHNVAKLGDFSYGLYIYAFPVQQTIIHFLSPNIPVWQLCVMTFLFTIPLAMFSWFVIEKRALKLKDVILKKQLTIKDYQLAENF